MIKQQYTMHQLIRRIGASEDIFKKMLNAGILGIEVYNTYQNIQAFNLRPVEVRELEKRYNKFTKQYGTKRALMKGIADVKD